MSSAVSSSRPRKPARRGEPDEGLDQGPPMTSNSRRQQPQPTQGAPPFDPNALQRFPTQGPPTPPLNTMGSKKRMPQNTSPTRGALDSRDPNALQRFPTQGPPTPPITMGSKKHMQQQNASPTRRQQQQAGGFDPHALQRSPTQGPPTPPITMGSKKRLQQNVSPTRRNVSPTRNSRRNMMTNEEQRTSSSSFDSSNPAYGQLARMQQQAEQRKGTAAKMNRAGMDIGLDANSICSGEINADHQQRKGVYGSGTVVGASARAPPPPPSTSPAASVSSSRRLRRERDKALALDGAAVASARVPPPPPSTSPASSVSSSTRRLRRERDKALAHAAVPGDAAAAGFESTTPSRKSSKSSVAARSGVSNPISETWSSDDDIDDYGYENAPPDDVAHQKSATKALSKDARYALDDVEQQKSKMINNDTKQQRVESRSKLNTNNSKDSKQNAMDDEMQHLKNRRADSFDKQKQPQSSDKKRDGDNDDNDAEHPSQAAVIPQPGAYRIGDNVSLEDEADLEEWRANRRAVEEEEEATKHQQPGAGGGGGGLGDEEFQQLQGPASTNSSRSFTRAMSLQEASVSFSVAALATERNKEMRKKRWPWIVGGIVVLLVIIIGVVVGVTSGKNGSGGDEKEGTAIPTTAPLAPQSPPTVMFPTSAPSLSVVPTIAGDTWSQVGGGLVGVASEDGLGVATSLSGDGTTIATSTIGNNLEFGSIITIATIGTIPWERRAPDLVMEDRATVSLSQDGTVILVGVPSQRDGFPARAAVYALEDGVYQQRGQNLTGSDDDLFATSIDMSDDGNRIAISDPSRATVTVYDWAVDSWIGTEITGHDAHTIALSGDGATLAVSATSDSPDDRHPGNVHVYRNSLNVFEPQRWDPVGQVLNAVDAPKFESSSALSLSSDGAVLAAGVYSYTEPGKLVDAGLAQVFAFDSSESLWKPRGSEIIGNIAEGSLGWSVALSADGSVMVVGAPGLDSEDFAPGYAQVFHFVAGDWRLLGQDEELDHGGVNGPSSVFGWDISISDDGRLVAVGDPFAEGEGGEVQVGRAQAFELL